MDLEKLVGTCFVEGNRARGRQLALNDTVYTW